MFSRRALIRPTEKPQGSALQLDESSPHLALFDAYTLFDGTEYSLGTVAADTAVRTVSQNGEGAAGIFAVSGSWTSNYGQHMHAVFTWPETTQVVMRCTQAYQYGPFFIITANSNGTLYVQYRRGEGATVWTLTTGVVPLGPDRLASVVVVLKSNYMALNYALCNGVKYKFPDTSDYGVVGTWGPRMFSEGTGVVVHASGFAIRTLTSDDEALLAELSADPWLTLNPVVRDYYSFPSTGIPTLSAASFLGRVPSVTVTY